MPFLPPNQQHQSTEGQIVSVFDDICWAIGKVLMKSVIANLKNADFQIQSSLNKCSATGSNQVIGRKEDAIVSFTGSGSDT